MIFNPNNQPQYINSQQTCRHEETKIIYEMVPISSMERYTTSSTCLSRVEVCIYCGKVKTQILNGVYYIIEWEKVN